MNGLRQIAHFVVYLYFLIVVARLVLEWVQAFARDWRPTGALLVVAEGIYTVTDPPLKALRSVLPVIRIGAFALDLSFIVLFIAISLLLRVL